MREEVYWYARTARRLAPRLEGDVEADAVVVGGGMAGLATAQWLREQAGLDVVLLEAQFCGAGATGKSSGFITPASELQLSDLMHRFGEADAELLWRSAVAGCKKIRSNIERFQIECDFVEADSLWVANGDSSFEVVSDEHDACQRLHYSSRLYDGTKLAEALTTTGFSGGVRTFDTFAIDGHAYAQGLKHALIEKGARVFEMSPAIAIAIEEVRTARGSVRAPIVVVCLDRFTPDLGLASDDVYDAQTFIALSEPLGAEKLRQVFPDGPLLVWDTDLIYQYFRPTADGRLLIGGGDLLHSFRGRESHDDRIARRLTEYVGEKFPQLGSVAFTHWWPGLIGIAKDILPIAGRSEGLHYAGCAAGLPWSVVAGETAARCAIEGSTELDRFLSPTRAFTALDPLQPILRKPAAFAISTLWATTYQKGDASEVAKQQRIVRAVLWGAVGLGALAAAHAVMKRFRH